MKAYHPNNKQSYLLEEVNDAQQIDYQLNQQVKTSFIIFTSQAKHWQDFVDLCAWETRLIDDVRKLKLSLTTKPSIVLLDLTKDNCSYTSLASVMMHFPKVRWFAYIKKEQLENEHIRLLISRLCIEYFTIANQIPYILNRLISQVNMLQLAIQDHQDWHQFDHHNQLGQSKAYLRLKEQMNRLAKTDACLLIYGEIGVGKTLSACKIHQRSIRRLRPCVAFDCENLRAYKKKPNGLEEAKFILRQQLESASEGSLILKNIESLPFELQHFVLACLSDSQLETKLQDDFLNVRILATTSLDLNDAKISQFFSPELIFRFNAMHLKVPSLSDRIEDLGFLAQHFLDKYCLKYAKPKKLLTNEAIEHISGYAWPGNFHELKSRLKHLALTVSEVYISKQHIDLPRLYFLDNDLKDLRDVCEHEALVRVLNTCDGKIQEAAKRLKISRASMYRLVNKHHLQYLLKL